MVKCMTLSISAARSWSKAMLPYVARTLTLQRPLSNNAQRRRTRSAGIDEYFQLSVNGHAQWLRIRGSRADNPILFYLHGGPGGSQIPSYRYYQLGWEKAFTVVHWEQRGAGKSYSRNLSPATMTLAQLVADALQVISYLHQRFQRNDIVLLGHSWGSLLAAHVLHRDASHIGAYVGVGQVSNQIKAERRMHQFALACARQQHDHTAIKQLSFSGYPETCGRLLARVPLVRYWARYYGYLGSRLADDARTYTRLMETPEYGVMDVYRFLAGTLLSQSTLGRSMWTDAAVQPTALPGVVSVPYFLISGQRDHFTPADMADEYLQNLRAPLKQHVVFSRCGHYPNEDEADRFLSTLKTLVAPFVDLTG